MRQSVARPTKVLVCPSCKATIKLRPDRQSVATCPTCGEWLAQHGRWGRRLEHLDHEESTDFDGSSEWGRSLVDEIR